MTNNAHVYGGRDINSASFINTSRNKYNDSTRANKSVPYRKSTKVTGINDRAGVTYRGATGTMPYARTVQNGAVHTKKTVKQEESFFYCFMHGFVFPALENARVTIKELRADSKARASLEKKPKYEKATKKAVFSMTFVFYLLTFTSLLIFLSMGYSKINEYTTEIETLKKSITEQNNIAAMLEIQIDSRDNLREIEHEAVTRLGMIKEENIPKKYISLERQDMIELKPEAQKEANLSVVMSGAAELLADFFR